MTQLQQSILAKTSKIVALKGLLSSKDGEVLTAAGKPGFDKSWGKGEFNKVGSPSPR